jgi:Mn-dependent DtxR family transcriptional regulator
MTPTSYYLSPGVVGEIVGRSPATVIEAFREYEDDGLVAHEPYEGVELTTAGRREAETLHETYVTLSWFFRSVLDLEEYEREEMEIFCDKSTLFGRHKTYEEVFRRPKIEKCVFSRRQRRHAPHYPGTAAEAVEPSGLSATSSRCSGSAYRQSCGWLDRGPGIFRTS